MTILFKDRRITIGKSQITIGKSQITIGKSQNDKVEDNAIF